MYANFIKMKKGNLLDFAQNANKIYVIIVKMIIQDVQKIIIMNILLWNLLL